MVEGRRPLRPASFVFGAVSCCLVDAVGAQSASRLDGLWGEPFDGVSAAAPV
jgi:hypothetical protein